MNERTPILIAALLCATAGLPGVVAIGTFYTPSFADGRLVLLPRELFVDQPAAQPQAHRTTRALPYTVPFIDAAPVAPYPIETTSITRIIPVAPALEPPTIRIDAPQRAIAPNVDRFTCIRVQGHVYCFTTMSASRPFPAPPPKG